MGPVSRSSDAVDVSSPQRIGRVGEFSVGESQQIHADGPMTDTRLFEEIDRRMKEIFARSPAADLEKNLRVLLQSTFSRLDLVTREEFDVQREVLARTRAKLAELEAKLAELEGKAEGGRRKAE